MQDATGIEFGEYLREAVCEPLGMPSTRLLGPAGHGARSSVDDLARFARDMLCPTVLCRMNSPTAHAVCGLLIGRFVPGYGRHRPNDWGLG